MTRVLSSRPAMNRRITGCFLVGGVLLGATTTAAGRLGQIDLVPSGTIASEKILHETQASNSEAETVVRLNGLAPEVTPDVLPASKEIQTNWPPQQITLLVEPWPERIAPSNVGLNNVPQVEQLEVSSVDEFEDPWMSQKRLAPISVSIPVDPWLL